jgi:hypothetical protein
VSFIGLVVVLAGLGVLSWASAIKVHAMNNQIQSYFYPMRAHMRCLQKVIDRHGRDPGFSLSFDPDLFKTLPSDHGLSRIENFFSRFLDHEHPTHVVCANGDYWFVLSEETYRFRYGQPRYRSLAKFIRPGTNGFLIYKHLDRYYGLHYQEGRFHPERDDYYYLLEGDTIAEILGKVPAARQREEEDRRTGRYIPPNAPVVPLGTVYQSFALFKADNRIYAIPVKEGRLVPAFLVANIYSSCYWGSSVAEVCRGIDAGERVALDAQTKSQTP